MATSDLKVSIFVDESPYQENAYLLRPSDKAICWIIDPGFPPIAEDILEAIHGEWLTPEAILLTHAHSDHIAGIESLRDVHPSLPILAPRAEADWLTDARLNLSAMFGEGITTPPATRLLDPGERLILAGLEFEVRDVSGHSIGGLAYYCAQAGVVFVGDALFASGIGRTDFPGSSHEQLLRNIEQNLLTLPGETVVYPGHGPATMIGTERAMNPYLQG